MQVCHFSPILYGQLQKIDLGMVFFILWAWENMLSLIVIRTYCDQNMLFLIVVGTYVQIHF